MKHVIFISYVCLALLILVTGLLGGILVDLRTRPVHWDTAPAFVASEARQLNAVCIPACKADAAPGGAAGVPPVPRFMGETDIPAPEPPDPLPGPFVSSPWPPP
jgi:hypothetical protein